MLVLVGLGLGCAGGREPLYIPMPDAELTVQPANQEGIAYPTTDIGGRPRAADSPGQFFPNLTLEGIRSVATIDDAAAVSMAEFFDPAGTRYDLLHVIGIFFWCPHCDNETQAMAKIAAWRAEHRVAVIQIAMQGYGGNSPGWSELQRWVRDHGLDFPVVVDAQGAALGKYFQVGSVPVNIAVDPRTMEVLAADVGEVKDPVAYEQGFLSTLLSGR